MDKFLRVQEVAQMLGVSKSTVWQYARENKLPKATKLSARVSVWKMSDVQKLIAEAA